MALRQINVSFPESLYKDFIRLVPAGERTRFLARLTEAGLRQLRLKAALDHSFGAWSHQPHPELKKGTAAFVRSLRTNRRSA